MNETEDWRLRGQEEYLRNRVFRYQKFIGLPSGSGHAHCEFCWHKFMANPEGVKDCSGKGYCSTDEIYWICAECFRDFNEKMNLRLADKG